MDPLPAPPYYPGHAPSRDLPLARFLPPIPEGALSAWLQANLPLELAREKNLWVLDPFGASPAIAIEAAQAGYRVLVAANNPITRFLIEMSASPPLASELDAALSELASARRGEERIEPHIRSLYMTRCDGCEAPVMAEGYVWERENEGQEPRLVARSYTCTECGKSGEFPATAADVALAGQFSSSSLHRARALERVLPYHDPDRAHVEEALVSYLPRAIYVLFTLINKLDGLALPAPRRKRLEALLLSALDQGNTLWNHPTPRPRPRQLGMPQRFREHNLWLALEGAVRQWAAPPQAPRVELCTWPAYPSEGGGVSLFEGRLKDLVEGLKQVEVGAAVCAYPRPNQAFWTLSALWAGWLWGKEAVGPFKSVLRRRRYDWGWHSVALRAALQALTQCLQQGVLLWGVVGEVEAGFLTAILMAADMSDYTPLGIALREESGQAQVTLQRSTPEERRQASITPAGVEDHRDERQLAALARAAAAQALNERAEPSSYLHLHAAALHAMAQQGALKSLGAQEADSESGEHAHSTWEARGQVTAILEKAFTYQAGFLRFGGAEKSLDTGQWWLRDSLLDVGDKLPLADQVEMCVVKLLLEHPELTPMELDRAVCVQFPGLLTPSAELIKVCLESYGQETPPGSGRWRIRQEDIPQTRRQELATITLLLQQIGGRIGFSSEGETPLTWRDTIGEVCYIWYIQASGLTGGTLLNRALPAEKSLVALPGGRANLISYKLTCNPRLRQAVNDGWRFIKFRQLRWLAESALLELSNLDEQLRLDSFTYNPPQLPLF
ncbi:MAG: hypothetical protein PHS96_10745 [Anaerolineales bacterium]|nr:hypothetical protein [Anaerolineales bacterium]